MKLIKQNILPILAIVGLTLSGASQAVLIDRGGGLIYDDELDVTWLQDANYARTSGYAAANLKNDVGFDDVFADGRMGWDAANTWVNQLSYGGYNDWRLPDVNPVNNISFNYNFSYDGSTDRGYNINSSQSELGYMFYQNLGNTGLRDVAGVLTGCTGADLCLTNTGLFDNLEPYLYWFGVEVSPGSDSVWAFATVDGFQGPTFYKPDNFYAWAVRSGDVTVSSVPVPAAFWLMASGLLGLVGLRKKR